MKYTKFLIFAVILISQLHFSQQSDIIQCLDNSGNPVDWWVILKMPKTYNSGKQYLYFDENSSDLSSNNNIDSSDSALTQTLAQIKDISDDTIFSVLWSDQPPGKDVSSSYAHSKGFVGGNQESGFIINHSTPRFPTVDDATQKIKLQMNPEQQIYGQHYFCMSVDLSTLNVYAKNLQIDRPFVYHSHIPSTFEKTLNELVTLSANKQKAEDYSTYTFKTLGGQSMVQFAKSGKYTVDLYYDIVAPTYGKSFIFETWGRSLMNATCGTNIDVVSNLYVTFSDALNYSYTNDHSKYGVATTGYTVCFGDLNRMTSQFKRGGGTNCFSQSKLHNILLKAFTKQQPCSTEQILTSSQNNDEVKQHLTSNQNQKDQVSIIKIIKDGINLIINWILADN